MKFTISIPAYNDSQSLQQLVNEAIALKHANGLDFDILIIDDGSADDTLAVAKKLKLNHAEITLISHERNLGFGTTLKEVFTLPKTDWVLFLPGDNQFPVNNLMLFLPLTYSYDYIIGFRQLRKDLFHRKFYSFIYNFLLGLLFNVKPQDVNSIVFFNKSVLRGRDFKSKSAFIHAELYLLMREQGGRIAEIPIVHQERAFGFGSGGNIKVIINTVIDLILYCFRK
ncbi:MAG: glycosyltransferase family 2 protein [Chitinophagales bacterium]|nr:glycosyltransferase family 2 protein [Chitinophagales bacterium]